MKDMDLKGAFCGRKLRTTIIDESLARAADLVCRNFTALCPNQLQVAGLAYIAMYSGFVYVAFVIDVSAWVHRRLPCLRSLKIDLALCAL